MQLVDVRSREEFEAVHIPGSVLLSQEVMRQIMASGSNKCSIVIIDHQGKNGLDVSAYFMGHGLEAVRCLQGGIDALGPDRGSVPAPLQAGLKCDGDVLPQEHASDKLPRTRLSGCLVLNGKLMDRLAGRVLSWNSDIGQRPTIETWVRKFQIICAFLKIRNGYKLVKLLPIPIVDDTRFAL